MKSALEIAHEAKLQPIADIASASHEQASGITQVSHAMAQMEQVTQQNAALVEQSAAAAENMAANAEQLVASVSRFRVEGGVATAARTPAVKPPAGPPPRLRSSGDAKRLSRTRKAPEAEWEEF